MQRMLSRTLPLLAAAASTTQGAAAFASKNGPLRVAVFGGTGYVGSRVCESLVKKGYDVTGISRRGVNPKPENEFLSQVTWVSGDATDPKTVKDIVKDSDAAVHAIGLLFDVDSGLEKLNLIVSGSGSTPSETSTYDNITRKTMFNLIDAVESKPRLPKLPNFGGGNNNKNDETSDGFPVCFVSAAEAGWPEVSMGQTVEDNFAPDWLKRYLAAKRVVEERMANSKGIRPVVYRPSLIWDWTKFDVLPVIPVFNLASAIGVPFVDKTIRVETLADAIAKGVEDSSVSGVQRFMQMEELAKQE